MFYSAAFFRIKFKAVHTEFWIVSSGQGMFYSSIHGFSFLRRHDKKRSFVSNYCGASQKLVTKLFCLLFTVCPSFFILSVYKKLYTVWFMAVLFFIYKEDFCHCLFIYYICVISIWTCFVLLYSCVSDFCSFSCFSLSFSFSFLVFFAVFFLWPVLLFSPSFFFLSFSLFLSFSFSFFISFSFVCFFVFLSCFRAVFLDLCQFSIKLPLFFEFFLKIIWFVSLKSLPLHPLSGLKPW